MLVAPVAFYPLISNPLFSHHNSEEIRPLSSVVLGMGYILMKGPVPLLKLNASEEAGDSIWPYLAPLDIFVFHEFLEIGRLDTTRHFYVSFVSLMAPETGLKTPSITCRPQEVLPWHLHSFPHHLLDAHW